MAKAPFAGSPNVADAPPVQLRGAYTPPATGNTVVEAVAQLGKTVGGVVEEQYKENLREGIKEQTRSLELALIARAFPKFAEQLLADRAKDDPVVQGAMSEMADIQSAIKQGVLPHQYANQRLSVIQANAIEAAPEFADEIRAAVQDVTGRDPERAFFSELLAPTKPKLTPEEKGIAAAREELAKQSALTGLSTEDLIRLGRQNSLLQAEKQLAETELRRGEKVAFNLEVSASNAVNLMTQDLYQDMFQQIQTGGVVDKESTIAAYNASVDAEIARLRNAIPEGTDPGVIKDTVDSINAQRDRMIGQLEDNSVINMITNNKDLMVKGMQLGILQSSPDLALAMALNPTDATRGLDLIVKMGESQFGRKLAGQLSATANYINNSRDGATRAYQYYLNIVTKGQTEAPEPINQQERNAQIIMTREAMKSQDATVQSHALQQMTNQFGEDFSWAALGNKDVFAAAAGNGQAIGHAVDGLYGSQEGGLRDNFTSIVTLPFFELSRMKIQGNQLVYESPPRSFSRGDIPNQDAEIQAWVTDFNETSRVAKMYADAGILSRARYSGINQMFEVVTGDAVAAAAERDAQRARDAQQNKVLRWEDDENGTPRLVED